MLNKVRLYSFIAGSPGLRRLARTPICSNEITLLATSPRQRIEPAELTVGGKVSGLLLLLICVLPTSRAMCLPKSSKRSMGWKGESGFLLVSAISAAGGRAEKRERATSKIIALPSRRTRKSIACLSNV